MNDDFSNIIKFELNIKVQNYFLKIMNNTDYTSLFYINNNHLFEYIIYPSLCQNISREILDFHDFKINIADLFILANNISYFLQFYNL